MGLLGTAGPLQFCVLYTLTTPTAALVHVRLVLEDAPVATQLGFCHARYGASPPHVREPANTWEKR